jgi:hypothetical protein
MDTRMPARGAREKDQCDGRISKPRRALHGELWFGNGDGQMFVPTSKPSSRVSLNLAGRCRDGSLAI